MFGGSHGLQCKTRSVLDFVPFGKIPLACYLSVLNLASKTFRGFNLQIQRLTKGAVWAEDLVRITLFFPVFSPL